MAALSRQLVVRRCLIFAIYYTAIYCGHNSMATKWRAKVFDSTNRRTGNSVPWDRIRSIPTTTCLSSVRIWVVLLDFWGEVMDHKVSLKKRNDRRSAIDVCNGMVGWNVNEIGEKWSTNGWLWMGCEKWEMIWSVRKIIVDFSNCEWNWQLKHWRGKWDMDKEAIHVYVCYRMYR